MAESLIGRALLNGEYQLREVLGRGGMATVFRAYSRSLDTDVAVKVLAPRLSSDPAFRERFHDEARSLARLHHPNLVEVYHYGEEADLVYIAMRLVPGGTLKDYVTALDGPLDLVATARMIAQVADALQHAHDHGLVHLDVKPANVLLGSADWPLLADFGITAAVQYQPTSQGRVRLAGTPLYMSPEQCQGGAVDGRSDQYSLAVTTFELLTGQQPFHAPTTEEILLRQVQDPPPPPRTLNPGIPSPVENVILRGLAKDPIDRYPSCRAFGVALIEAVEQTRGASLETKAALAATAPNLLALLGLSLLMPVLLGALPRPGILGTRLPFTWPFQLLLALLVFGLFLGVRWHLIGLLSRLLGAEPGAAGRAARPGSSATLPGVVAAGVQRTLGGTVEGAVNLAYLYLGYRFFAPLVLDAVGMGLGSTLTLSVATGLTILVVLVALAIVLPVARTAGPVAAVISFTTFVAALGSAPPGAVGLLATISSASAIRMIVALVAVALVLATRPVARPFIQRLAAASLFVRLIGARPAARSADAVAARSRLSLLVGIVVDFVYLLVGNALLSQPLVDGFEVFVGALTAAIAVTGIAALIWLGLALRLRAVGGNAGLTLGLLLGVPLLTSLPVLQPPVLGSAGLITAASWGVGTAIVLLVVAVRGGNRAVGAPLLGPSLERGLLGASPAMTEAAAVRRSAAFAAFAAALLDVIFLVVAYWALGLPIVSALMRATGQSWLGSAATVGVALLAAAMLWSRLRDVAVVVDETTATARNRQAAFVPAIVLALVSLFVAGCAAAPTVFAEPDFVVGLAPEAFPRPQLVIDWQQWLIHTPSPSEAAYSLALSCTDGQTIGEFREAMPLGAGVAVAPGSFGAPGPTGSDCRDWRNTYATLRHAAGLTASSSRSWSWLDVRVTLAPDGTADVVETHRVLFTAGRHGSLVWTEPAGVDGGPLGTLAVREGGLSYPVEPGAGRPDHYARLLEENGKQRIGWWFPDVVSPDERTYTIAYRLANALQSSGNGSRFHRSILTAPHPDPVWRTTVEVVLPETDAPETIHLAATGVPERHGLTDPRTAWFEATDVPADGNLVVDVSFGGRAAPPSATPTPTIGVNPTSTPSVLAQVILPSFTPTATETSISTPMVVPATSATDSPTAAVTSTPTPVPTSTDTPNAKSSGTPPSTATSRPTTTVLPSATPTLLATETPTPTSTPSTICAGDEHMTFSPTAPVVGQVMVITVSSSKNLPDVALSGPYNPQGPTARTISGGFAWDWQVTPTAVGHLSYAFFAQGSTLCTINVVDVGAGAPTATPTLGSTPTNTPLPPTLTSTPALSATPTLLPPTGTSTPLPSPTFTPTRLPTRTATIAPTPTKTPCPPLGNPMVNGASNFNGTQLTVTVTWSSTGGCGPFTGTIVAQYNPGTKTYRIFAPSGQLTDLPPGCPYPITYTLNLRDSTGQSVSSSTTVTTCG